MTSSATHDLIAAIYAATLSPDNFYSMLDRLDLLIFAENDPAAEGQGAVERRIGAVALAHVDLARSIQQRIGRAGTYDEKVNAIIESIPNASYALTRAETLVAANGMALAKYGPLPARLDALVPDDGARRQIRRFLQQKAPGLPLAVSAPPEPDRPSAGSMVISAIDPELVGGASDLYLLSIADFGFHDDSTRLLRDAHGLTAAEAQIALMLASGLRAPEIAAEREVSIETVRTQIKVIKGKTGARDIAELVRQVCGISAGVLAPRPPVAAPPADSRKSTAVKTRRQFQLPDGRRLEVLEQGAADGRPVLLFHNLPYGIELPAAAIAQAHRDNLRIIAPVRPGMGQSDPLPGIGLDDLLTQVARDCRELLARLGIRQPAALLSHSTGAAFALRFARLFPDSVSHMIGVARAPAWREEWLTETPRRQRFMLRLARHLPRLLPVVAWAMVTCMDSKYGSEFLIHTCKDGASDSKALVNGETVDLILRGIVDALRNNLDALCNECLIIQHDFTEEARAVPHKFHLLHGADDRIVPLTQPQTFARAVPGTTLELIEDAGQLLFYSHWPRILSALGAPAAR